jgi:hypothetical protein
MTELLNVKASIMKQKSTTKKIKCVPLSDRGPRMDETQWIRRQANSAY